MALEIVALYTRGKRPAAAAASVGNLSLVHVLHLYPPTDIVGVEKPEKDNDKYRAYIISWINELNDTNWCKFNFLEVALILENVRLVFICTK